MERVNLTKFGFIRDKSLDFNDDGNRFSGFRWSEDSSCCLSKCVYNWEAFLSAHIDGELPYEVYSKLPSYNTAVWKYNGINLDELTDDDLKELYEACVSYEKEYRATEGSIQYPTIEELVDQCKKIQEKLISEVNELECLMGRYGMEAAVKFSKYEWSNLQHYLNYMVEKVNRFNPLTLPQSMYRKSSSFTFMKEDNSDLVSPTYWYTSIKEMFENHKII